jgi:protein gp37
MLTESKSRLQHLGDHSTIEWTDATWNPVTGCTKVSAGCDNCYAERLATRLQKWGVARYRDGFTVALHPDVVELPLHWRTPRRVFVNSMSDLFHGSVPISFIDSVFDVMERAPQHTFQVLTKRPGRMAAYVTGFASSHGRLVRVPRYPGRGVPPNVWLGTSVEDEQVVDRIDHLRRVPGPVRFLSCEPLLGPLRGLNLTNIDWVIVGGESGPGHRPIQRTWVRDLRRQCRTARIPFFFKQWGGWTSKAGGRELDGRTYDGMPRPQLPRVALKLTASA